MAERICKNCEYFEDWHGWSRGDCDHPSREVAVEVDAFGTCDKFEVNAAGKIAALDDVLTQKQVAQEERDE